MKTPASGMATLAWQVYTPPWLVRRGEKISVPVNGDRLDTVTASRVPFPISIPSLPIHTMTGDDALSCCSKVTVQVMVRFLPAKKLPLPTSSIGSVGAAERASEKERKRERVEKGENRPHSHLNHPSKNF